MDNKFVFKENNLDLIRLFAASQVAVLHSFEFMFAEKTGNIFFELLRLTPGVPIFFFISGYLISKSFEKTPKLIQYSKNRGLRIFPALYICVFINILMVYATGYLSQTDASFWDLLKLFFAKVTFLQFYNPDFMRQFGDGVLNGSLWTICVELQFYVLIPIIYAAFAKNNHLSNKTVIILIGLFFIANRIFSEFQYSSESGQIWFKLLKVSFLPWFYMFLVGVFFQRNSAAIYQLLRRFPTILLFMVYIIAAITSSHYGANIGNNLNPILFLLLSATIFKLAYTKPNMGKILRGNDLSYGIYIWHMPIVNQMIFLNYNQDNHHALVAIVATILVSSLSWAFIEKPSLTKKTYSLHPAGKK